MRDGKTPRTEHGRPKRGAALAAALALVIVSLVAAVGEGVSPEVLDPLLRNLGVRPLWGDPPPFTLPGLDGKRYSLASLKDRGALLYFWATW